MKRTERRPKQYPLWNNISVVCKVCEDAYSPHTLKELQEWAKRHAFCSRSEPNRS